MKSSDWKASLGAPENRKIVLNDDQLLAAKDATTGARRAGSVRKVDRGEQQQLNDIKEQAQQAALRLLTWPSEDPEGLLNYILPNALRLVGAAAGYIALLDDKGENYVLRCQIGTTLPAGMTQPVRAGALGEVCRRGEMLFVADYRHYKHRVHDPLFDSVATYLAMPITIHGKVQGALVAIWYDTIHHVTDEAKEMYRQFAILAALVIERVYASARISHQNELLQQLTEATASLVDEHDMDEALPQILHKASSFMGITEGYILLFESGKQSYTFQCGLGRFALWIGKSIPFTGENKGVFGEVLRTGRLVIVEDYQNWPQRMEHEFTVGVTSAVLAPLIVDGETIGAIGLAGYGESLPVDRDKLIILEQYARIAATAIRHLMAYREINRLAYYDPSTGLPNREHMKGRLQEEMDKAGCGESSGAVLHIDLDDFQSINDHYGHTYGDKALVAIGFKIVSALGAAYVSRIGGDEFITILPEADIAKITAIADMLLTAISTDCEIEGERFHITASIGITLYPNDGGTAEDILKHADIAMHAAKGASKNNWRFFESAMIQIAYDQMVLANSLRRALDNGELYLQYQPQVALPGKEIIGFEALIRWNSKEHGQVAPSRFIPLAEKKGMIRRPIGQWVTEEACRFARKLTEMGRPDLFVAVNVSPWQLAADDLGEVLCRSMKEAGVNPRQVEVEITESALIESLSASIDKLNQLKAHGIRLSLDDFGTGYSSLTHLRSLPVETIKIDKTFIDRMVDNEEEESFIKLIIDMAHLLKLTVVAEGVETEAQLDILGGLGCDVIQGYVISRPVGEQDALNLAAR